MTTAAAPAIRIPRPVTIGLGGLVAAGFAAIAAITFITSFAAVSDLAVDRGIVRADLGWAIPLGIDGLIVVASAVAWIESLRDGRWHPFPVVVVALAAALSVAANVAHADTGNWLSRALAASPPAGLLLSVELAAWALRRAVRLGALGQPAAPRDRRPGRWRLRTHPDMVADDIDRLDAVAFGRSVDPPATGDRDPVAGTVIADPDQPTNGHRPTGNRAADLTDLWQQLQALAADPDRPTPTSQRQVADALNISRHQAGRLKADNPDRFAELTSTAL